MVYSQFAGTGNGSVHSLQYDLIGPVIVLKLKRPLFQNAINYWHNDFLNMNCEIYYIVKVYNNYEGTSKTIRCATYTLGRMTQVFFAFLHGQYI